MSFHGDHLFTPNLLTRAVSDATKDSPFTKNSGLPVEMRFGRAYTCIPGKGHDVSCRPGSERCRSSPALQPALGIYWWSYWEPIQKDYRAWKRTPYAMIRGVIWQPWSEQSQVIEALGEAQETHQGQGWRWVTDVQVHDGLQGDDSQLRQWSMAGCDSPLFCHFVSLLLPLLTTW